jgi:hypothetical protein
MRVSPATPSVAAMATLPSIQMNALRHEGRTEIGSSGARTLDETLFPVGNFRIGALRSTVTTPIGRQVPVEAHAGTHSRLFDARSGHPMQLIEHDRENARV